MKVKIQVTELKLKENNEIEDAMRRFPSLC